MTHLYQQLAEQFSSNEWPRFDAAEHDQNNAVLHLAIHQDIRWFEGHFPEQPVLAGVVQTHWAGSLAQYLFNLGDTFKRLDNLKFQSVILPDQELQLALEYSPNKGSVTFKYFDAERAYSAGKIVF